MDVDIVLPDQRDEPLLPSSTSSTLNMWHDKGNRPMTVCLDEEIIHLEDAEHTQHIARPVDLNHLTQDKLEKAISSRRASLRHLVLLSNAYSASIGTDSALECRTGNAYDGEKATLIENENDRIALVKLQEQQWFDNLLETFAGDDLPSEEDSGLIITDLGENATTRTAMPETSDISSDYPSECLAAIDGFAAKRICGRHPSYQMKETDEELSFIPSNANETKDGDCPINGLPSPPLDTDVPGLSPDSSPPSPALHEPFIVSNEQFPPLFGSSSANNKWMERGDYSGLL